MKTRSKNQKRIEEAKDKTATSRKSKLLKLYFLNRGRKSINTEK